MERKVKQLVCGDRWRLELESKRPGEAFLVVHIDGEQQGRLPIGNVLEPLARFDPALAGAREDLVRQLRGEVSDWKSRYYDNVADQVELDQMRALKSSYAEAVAKYAAVRRDRSYALIIAGLFLLGMVVVALTK